MKSFFSRSEHRSCFASNKGVLSPAPSFDSDRDFYVDELTRGKNSAQVTYANPGSKVRECAASQGGKGAGHQDGSFGGSARAPHSPRTMLNTLIALNDILMKFPTLRACHSQLADHIPQVTRFFRGSSKTRQACAIEPVSRITQKTT